MSGYVSFFFSLLAHIFSLSSDGLQTFLVFPNTSTSRVSSLCIKGPIPMLFFSFVSLSFLSCLKPMLGCPQRVFPGAPKLQDSLFIRDQWLERLLGIP